MFDHDGKLIVAVGRIDENFGIKEFALEKNQRLIGLIARGQGDGIMRDV